MGLPNGRSCRPPATCLSFSAPFTAAAAVSRPVPAQSPLAVANGVSGTRGPSAVPAVALAAFVAAFASVCHWKKMALSKGHKNRPRTETSHRFACWFAVFLTFAFVLCVYCCCCYCVAACRANPTN